jgi:hypothetical protein
VKSTQLAYVSRADGKRGLVEGTWGFRVMLLVSMTWSLAFMHAQRALYAAKKVTGTRGNYMTFIFSDYHNHFSPYGYPYVPMPLLVYESRLLASQVML